MDARTLKAASGASAYDSFADATRSVLDLLERHLPGSAVFLAHLDRAQATFRVVDARGGKALGLKANLALPLGDSLCAAMAEGRAPRRCDDVAGHAVLGPLAHRLGLGIRSYLGVPVELSNGARVGSLAAYAPERDRFGDADERLFAMLARVLAVELERESAARDAPALNDAMRTQARGMGSLERVAGALTGGQDARPIVCAAACEVARAPVCFLLEPSGPTFTSTAVHGADLPPVTIQARSEVATPGRRAFTAKQPYFVADARNHPALAAPLVEATGARSALFEPVLRDGQVAGVLILIWRSPVPAVPEATAGLLRLLAAQAAVAIEQEGLRARAGALALSDPLTGVASQRVWEEELPRELARARRYELPLCVAVLDLDHLAAFNESRGSQEGDRLLKETAAAWRGRLRDVDLLARLDGAQFGALLPSCGVGEACEVLDRVREATPRGQTSSAGVARWDGEEPVELLVLRARDALAAAKAAGRDATIAAE